MTSYGQGILNQYYFQHFKPAMHLSLILAILLSESLAHSWIEQLTVITNGVFTGRNGYPRGYISRSDPGFSDNLMTYLLPPLNSGRTRVDDTDLLCAPSQRTHNQTAKYPHLQAPPGSYVAIKYLENGHVTLPQNQPGKPSRAGTVYLFGTNKPDTQERLTEVLQWTSDSTGGDRRGKLLAAQKFDDGRCYQINNNNISLARQKEFPNPVPDIPGSVHEQWCEIDIIIPADIPADSSYAVYWVWEWPTSPGAPGLPRGKDEYYTTCSDLEIVAGPIQDDPPNPLFDQDPQTAAIASF